MNLHTVNTISFSLKTNAFRMAFFLILFVFAGLSSLKGQDGYFQQHVSYDIKVSLNDINHYMTGTIGISYKNNSPDTLTFIWMHLWPNAYSDRNTALSQQLLEEGRKGLYFAPKEDLGFIDQIAFSTEGKPMIFKLDPEHIDIGKLQLTDPLLPGAIIEFSTPFRVKIPSGKFSRMGHIGESYQISQWFPKPAVYDRDGWHEMPYLDQGEFYSEFGTFRVEITLPENYVVASTGRLQEASERAWLLEKAKATAALTNFDTTLSFPASSKTLKTLTFIQDSIHDFAWFADKRFHVLKSEFILPESGNPIECWAYFTNKQSTLWKNSLEYIENGLRYYSERVGAYPYSSYSAVDGTITAGGGMEYPMITVIGSSGSAAGLEEVIVHELGHSWFYGILGSNERENGWMDEGLNSFYEMKYLDANDKGIPLPDEEQGKAGFKIKIPGFDNKISAKDGFRFAVAYTSFDNSDQPVKTPSQQFTYTNYGAVMYSKTALAFDFLEDYLGTPAFDKAMHDYYGIWKFRHPGPADIESAFENSSQKDLDWFFNGLLSTTVPVNYTIKKSTSGNGSLQLDITNKGIVAAPFKIQEGTETPVWIEGFSGSKSITLTGYNDSAIFLNKGYSQLLKTNGSRYRNRALLRSAKDYRIRLFPQLVPKENSETFVLLPMVAWNRYNEGMAGIVFSNFSLFPDNFEFTLAPLYDFKNNDLAGIGSLKYHIWPVHGIFKEITTSVHGKRFAYAENTYGPENTVDADEPVYNYSKLSPEILVKFRKKNPRATLQHMLSYRNISLWLDEEYSDSITTHKNITSYLNYNELVYGFSDNRTLDPYSGLIRAEQGKNYSKISGEFKYRFSYAKFNKGVDIRFFAGGFIDNGNSNTRNYNLRMSGWEGSQDYLYDELFFGRTDDHGFWKQQFLVRDGGFKTPTFVGQSNKWIAALNVDVDMPAPIPVSIFAGLGTYDGITTVFNDLDNVVMYECGIAIKPIRDILEIYVPLLYSDDINQTLDLNNIDFWEQIRFVFNINKITPYALRNRFLEER